MAEPFLSELRIMSFDFAPKGWAQCNGQLMPINQNQPLFSLLGTTFGGDGRTTFALPNLQGRAPLHPGAGHVLGEAAGEYAHTLTTNEMTEHVHPVVADNTTANTTDGNLPMPPTRKLAGSAGGDLYGPAAALQPMNPGAVSMVGSSQPHDNTMPYLTLLFVIALVGIFPSRN
jgi:microcystin-dependent protein